MRAEIECGARIHALGDRAVRLLQLHNPIRPIRRHFAHAHGGFVPGAARLDLDVVGIVGNDWKIREIVFGAVGLRAVAPRPGCAAGSDGVGAPASLAVDVLRCHGGSLLIDVEAAQLRASRQRRLVDAAALLCPTGDRRGRHDDRGFARVGPVVDPVAIGPRIGRPERKCSG